MVWGCLIIFFVSVVVPCLAVKYNSPERSLREIFLKIGSCLILFWGFVVWCIATYHLKFMIYVLMLGLSFRILFPVLVRARSWVDISKRYIVIWLIITGVFSILGMIVVQAVDQGRPWVRNLDKLLFYGAKLFGFKGDYKP